MEQRTIPSPKHDSRRYLRVMDLRVLGPLEVAEASQLLPLGGLKQRTVLALLIAHNGRRLSTDSLIDGVYGDEAPEGARRTIQTYVSNLRGQLGDLIQAGGAGYVLTADRSDVDALRFEDVVTSAADLDDPGEVADRLRDALAIWRGQPYADVDGLGTITAEVTRLNELRVVAVERRIDADLDAGHHAALIAELESLTVEYPLREHFRAQQMLALYRSGRQAEALRAYEKARLYLVEETGLDPSPELRELETRILAHDERIGFSSAPPVSRKALLALDLEGDLVAEKVAPDRRVAVFTETDQVILDALARRDGHVFAQRLNVTFAHFDRIDSALGAAGDILRDAPRLAADDHRCVVRGAVDFGDVEMGADGILAGPVVSRVAGLIAMAHPGQVLLSTAAQVDAARVGGWTIKSLGDHPIPYLDRAEGVHQLVRPDQPEEFPAPRTDGLPVSVPGGTRSMPGYELRQEIDRDPRWIVWRAYQPSVGREVAMKIIGPELSGRPEFVRRFEMEALTVARLDHPHIVPLYDYWRDLSGAYLVTRWIRGTTLEVRIAQGPLSLADATRFLDQIGSAVDAAHQAGVTHGDIRPGTILVDEQGEFFLADFGIARNDARTSDDPGSDIDGLARTLATALDGADGYTQELAGILASAASLPTVVELRAAFGAEAGSDLDPTRVFTETRNPYHSLNAFTFADAIDFFGRESLVAELVGAIESQRFTAVVGPSGVGKSSLVQAGLVPALVDGAVPGSSGWFIATMTPGSHPFEAMASALLRVATSSVSGLDAEIVDGDRGVLRVLTRLFPPSAEVLVVIDQFEELFTLTDKATRLQFLRGLATAVTDPASNVRVLVTLRADFFDQPLEHPEFGELLRTATVPLSAPTNHELREIVERPAAGVGVGMAPGLVDQILRDIGEEPGRLPLLEFALTELFVRRATDVVGPEAYEEIGGVLGALGGGAEAVYQDLDAAAASVARQVFLRLLTLPDAERVTRRRVRMTELRRLDQDSAVVDEVVEAFSRHRLLTLDRDPITHGPTVEVAHEAMFSEWKRLAGWIEDRRDDLTSRRRLVEATQEWETAERQDAMLLGGARLVQLEEWAASTDLSLSVSERELVEASVAKRDADAADRRRVRRLVMAGLAAAAVVALVLAGVAAVSRNNAQRSRDLATARELAAQSIAQLDVDPEQSVLLALEAVDAGRTAGGSNLLESTAALRRALASHRIVDRFDGGAFVAVSPDGKLIATGTADGAAIVRALDTGGMVAELPRPDGPAVGAGFSPAGDRIAIVYAASHTPVWIWDLESGSSVQLEGPDMTEGLAPIFVAFDESGEFVATGSSIGVNVWSAVSGELILSIDVEGDSQFVPGTNQLLVADSVNRALQIFDVTTGLLVEEFSVPLHPQSLAVSPDGQLVIITSQQDLSVGAYEVVSGTEMWRATVDRPFGAVWLSDGDRVAVGSDGGRVTLLDGGTGMTVDVLNGGHVGIVWALATVPDRGLLATSGDFDGTTIVWNVEPGPIAEIARLDTGARRARLVDYAPFPDQVFVSDLGTPAAAKIIDVATMEAIIDVADPIVGASGRETHVVGDGSLLATITTDGPSTLRDVRTGQVVYEAPAEMLVRAASYDNSLALLEHVPADDAPVGGHQIIDIATGAVVATIDKPSLNLPWFSYDGSWIWDWDDVGISLYDTRNGESALSIPDVMTVLPMPDGKTISIVDNNGTLWHASLNELLAGETLDNAALWSAFATQGFVVPLGHVANSDGTLVSTTARRGEPVKIWDTATGVQVAQLDPELTNGVPHVFFHPDEPYVTLLSEGGILLTYTLDTDELIAIARSRITRSLTEPECMTFLHLEECPVNTT